MNPKVLRTFYILFSLLNLAANLAHPVTPALFTQLGLPDYMFGVAFAAMSSTNFLFCPFWGRLSDRIGRIRVVAISLCGYGVGQLLFMLATTSAAVVAARLFSGVFVGGYMVACMAYLADLTSLQNRARHMSYYAAAMSVNAAAGFLIGGLIGDSSIRTVFLIQATLLIAIGVAFPIFLREARSPQNGMGFRELVRSANPFSSFVQAGRLLTPPLIIFLVVVFLTSFATNGYDNSFNYYIRQEFGFPPSYNGIIKAATGIVGLIANLTINQWLARHTDGRKSIVGVLLLCAVSLFSVVFLRNVALFIACNIIFYTFNTMYLPIQQTLAVQQQDEQANGAIAGVFNSVKAVGMIAGALFAGFAYTINNKSPFLFGAAAFLLGAGISVYNRRQYLTTGDSAAK